jgi:putative ABC transport system ATP-binding protein
MAPAPRIQVRDLRVVKGDHTILESVDADFGSERVTAIVGPSGSGKTTFLRCLNRLEEPDAGTVLLDGKDVKELDPVDLRKRVGMIFQTPVLFEGGVRANLEYGLGALSDSRLEDALRKAGLPQGFLQRSSSALSVGQAQRVTIARALVREPEMLLLDEPTSALDKDASAGIESLMKDLAGGGLGIVLVTHDLDQASRVADRAFLLHDRRLLGDGSPDDIPQLWAKEVRE